ncbi:unnamed protein product, partial [Mesorhabditis belari]|uniref:Uncharacterized protein n=1 Tax=Mesorhabditis belari TaxID=2138241 RepID=A0AAF3J2Y4_9BILA
MISKGFLLGLCFFVAKISAQNVTRSKRQDICMNLNEVRTCYANYITLYGLLAQNVNGRPILQRYELYDRLIKVTDLTTICKNFDVLRGCLGGNEDLCITPNTMLQITSSPNDARDYLLDYSFFQSVCGIGKDVFLENQMCLSNAFAQGSLSNRIVQCGGSSSQDQQNQMMICDRGIAAVGCVRDQFSQLCGIPSGKAVCSAAVNMARGLREADVTCIQQMDFVCNSIAHLQYPLFTFALIFLFFKC